MIYTLIHERDPIPCRTTYIEYTSPVKIFINFLRNTTQFHWFSLHNTFFLIVLRHQSWGVPFGEPKKLIFFYNIKRSDGLESRAAAEIQQNLRKKYFPGSKWIAGNILCIGFFFDSGRCFYSMYRFFLPIPEDAFGGRNYQFCILCMPSTLYIHIYIYTYIYIHIYTHVF